MLPGSPCREAHFKTYQSGNSPRKELICKNRLQGVQSLDINTKGTGAGEQNCPSQHMIHCRSFLGPSLSTLMCMQWKRLACLCFRDLAHISSSLCLQWCASLEAMLCFPALLRLPIATSFQQPFLDHLFALPFLSAFLETRILQTCKSTCRQVFKNALAFQTP